MSWYFSMCSYCHSQGDSTDAPVRIMATASSRRTDVHFLYQYFFKYFWIYACGQTVLVFSHFTDQMTEKIIRFALIHQITLLLGEELQMTIIFCSGLITLSLFFVV